jgi:hypothetical protein
MDGIGVDLSCCGSFKSQSEDCGLDAVDLVRMTNCFVLYNVCDGVLCGLRVRRSVYVSCVGRRHSHGALVGLTLIDRLVTRYSCRSFTSKV